jgi:hypothetical protein
VRRGDFGNLPMTTEASTERRICIFCGGLPLSKEHIYASWMGPYLSPNIDGTVHTKILEQVRTNGMRDEVHATLSIKPGDHRSRKLRVVCAACNNGWMSLLQERARPHLAPLLNGEWTRLTLEAQTAISAWACMFTMVYERADMNTAAVRQDQRNQLFRTRDAPSSWCIWVGKGTKRYGDTITTLHRGWGLLGQRSTMELSEAQVTLATPGRLCFLTFYSVSELRPPELVDDFDRLALQAGLMRVWPPVQWNIFMPLQPGKVIDDASAVELLDKLGQIFMQRMLSIHLGMSVLGR